MICIPISRRRRRILVDVDTQNHFFLNDSPLHVDDHLSVLDNIQKVFKWAHHERVPIISTVQVNNGCAVCARSFSLDAFSVQKCTGTLCRRRLLLEARDSTDLPAKVVEHHDQVILQKRSFDPFAEPRSDRLFTELQADEFIIIGAPAEGAVKATALGLLARGKHVTLVADATGSFSPSLGRKARQRLKAKGVRLTDTDALVSALQMV